MVMIDRPMMDDNISAIVASDLPRGVALLADLTTNIKNVTVGLLALKEKIENDELNSSKGLSLLELKNQSFLMYLSNLAYVTLRKLRGAKLENDPSIDRLVELRVVLERIRPLEDKLKYQIDKFLKIATEGVLSEDDPTRLKGNLDNIGSSSDEEEDEENTNSAKSATKEEDKTYKIPKVSQTPYEEQNSRETEKEKARRRTLNSSMVQEALYDFTNDPEVVYNMDALKQKAIKRRKELEAYEEDNMIRKSLTKRERAAMNEITTAGTMGSEILGFNSLDALYDGYEPKGPQAKKRKTGKSPKVKGKGKKGGKKRKH
ncbi:neuroguidin [Penaeus vannamei]|uniref:neuroguidin n=1 Tax=Penaeus vannamei TaxID=6689 RepID=UPI00387F8941